MAIDIPKLQDKIDKNLTKSDQLFKFIEHFIIDLSSPPSDHDHYGAHVKHVNNSFSYKEFWDEFNNSLVKVVFGDKAEEKTLGLEQGGARDTSAATIELYKLATQHFKSKNNQGKIGEAFLFFFIEKIFKACRVGSKFQLSMPHDQQKGSDAVHIGIEDNQPCFYIGEAKFYQTLYSALSNALDSLKSHRDKDTFSDELKWLKGTEACYKDFSGYLDDLGSYDYSIKQIVFILLKEDTVDLLKIKEHIENLLEQEFAKQQIIDKLNHHPSKDELHLILFLVPKYPEANEEFTNIFGVEITPAKN